MKKYLTLSVILTFILIVGSSCKKESAPVDARDKFVGTWKGTFTLKIPGLSIDQSESATQVISKSSSTQNQILFDGSTKASVNGNGYTYIEWTETVTNPNVGSIIFIFNGTGSISGSVITESGTVKTTILGITYSGTWSSILNKQ